MEALYCVCQGEVHMDKDDSLGGKDKREALYCVCQGEVHMD